MKKKAERGRAKAGKVIADAALAVPKAAEQEQNREQNRVSRCLPELQSQESRSARLLAARIQQLAAPWGLGVMSAAHCRKIPALISPLGALPPP